ncbi:MAG: hypothetical protein PF439_12500 [Helicobacteraceae bacterium]|nr:hypothetical protein [Helicobacteraceae bacterium]
MNKIEIVKSLKTPKEAFEKRGAMLVKAMTLSDLKGEEEACQSYEIFKRTLKEKLEESIKTAPGKDQNLSDMIFKMIHLE